jgi:hypothetical protein
VGHGFLFHRCKRKRRNEPGEGTYVLVVPRVLSRSITVHGRMSSLVKIENVTKLVSWIAHACIRAPTRSVRGQRAGSGQV